MASRWQTYLEGLPDGLHSYPECKVKAASVRAIVESFGRPVLPADAPEELRLLAHDPPPGSVFVPVAHAYALYHAMGDALFYNDDQMIARARAANAKLMHSPIYRVLLVFVSPDKMVKGSPSRWNSFHRNFPLIIDLADKGRCKGHIEAPPGVVTMLMSRMHSSQFEIALEAVGAKRINTTTAEVLMGGRTFVQSDTTWSE